MKYIRKQEVVEAIQYTNLTEAKRFLGIRDANYDKYTRDLIVAYPQVPTIDARKYVASEYDYIIRDKYGVYSVCTPVEFGIRYKEHITPMDYVKHVLVTQLRKNKEVYDTEEPTEYRKLREEFLLEMAVKLQVEIKPESWEK